MIAGKRGRAVRASQRREQIQKVSLRLFARKGYHATSIRDIARSARVTEGLIYHYFDGKEHLLRSLIEQPLSQGDPFDLSLLPPNISVEEALLSIGQRFFEKLSLNKDLFRLMIGESHLFEKEGDLFFPQMIYEQCMKRIGGFLHERMEKGELRKMDPILAARQFLGSLVAFFLFQEILSGKNVVSVEPKEFLTLAIEIFLRGVERTGSHGVNRRRS